MAGGEGGNPAGDGKLAGGGKLEVACMVGRAGGKNVGAGGGGGWQGQSKVDGRAGERERERDGMFGRVEFGVNFGIRWEVG